MTYGLDSTGFTAPETADVLSQIQAELLARISPLLNLSPTGDLGILSGIIAEREALLWSALQQVWSAGDPAAAQGTALDVICALTGTVRRPPAHSVVRGAQFTLHASTAVPAGAIVRVAGDVTARFRTLTDIISTTAGVYVGDLEAISAGPVIANAGTLTDIVTAVDGWVSVSNPTDAELGDAGELDPALRLRRIAEIAATGTGTSDAIRGRLLRYRTAAGVPAFTQVSVDENTLDYTDSYGLPPHSVEVVLHGDPIDPDEVAQILWDNGVAAGIATYGSSVGMAVDSEGRRHPVHFSGATNVPCVFEVTIGTTGAFPANGVALLKYAIQSYPYTEGATVYRSQLYPSILAVPGVSYISRIRAARAGAPLADADLPMARREIAYAQNSDITVIVQ